MKVAQRIKLGPVESEANQMDYSQNKASPELCVVKWLMPMLLEETNDAAALKVIDSNSIARLEDGNCSETATPSNGVPPIHCEQPSSRGWTRCCWEGSMMLTKSDEIIGPDDVVLKKKCKRDSSSSVKRCIERKKKRHRQSIFFQNSLHKLHTTRCIASLIL